MAQLKCLCGRWCEVGGDVRYCAACSKPLDVEPFKDLIALDDVAASQFVKTRGWWVIDVCNGFAISFLSGMGLGQLGVSNRWQMILALCIYLAYVISAPLMRRRKYRKLTSEYRRLWSSPACFRPSIPKPE